MQNAIEIFIESLGSFIDFSLGNELFQILYGFLAVAFAVAIIIKIIKI